MKPIVLCILDGVGMRADKHGNAVKLAYMPTFHSLIERYPHSLLEASGVSVGLPDGQMGNSEVGHMNIGAGRIVYQPLELINNKISDGTFYNNKNLNEVIDYTIKKKSKLHIFGLLSDGGIHSHINHLFAIIKMCEEKGIKDIYFHVFLDGRDTLPKSALTYLDKLQAKIDECNIGVIATISGRYYAMDRDNRWDRVEKAYNVMTKKSESPFNNYREVIEKNYNENKFDEFVEPAILDQNGIVEENDGLILFNYRPDRARELFSAFTNPEFSGFERTFIPNLKLVTMMPVSNEVICKNAFPHENLKNTLGEYISKHKLKQLRIAETEKYAHVTYFFDGGIDNELPLEKRILIPSKKVATYDLEPSMSALEITDNLIKELDNDNYDLVILNYANGDMVGHTGNLEATVKSLEVLDTCLDRLKRKVEEKNGLLIVTADHGNSDYMLDDNDNIITSHSVSKVPLIIANQNYNLKDGKLGDIAPTILYLMGLKIPKEMTGEILLEGPKKKRSLKKGNIFIILSMLFLLSILGIYAYRFIHYYNLEHPKTSESDNSLVSKIINQDKLVSTGDGLQSIGDEYIFKGQVKDNYVYYSNRLWRIVKVNNDKTIKLITDDIVTSMVWNYNNNDYKSSYVRNYLNSNDLEYTGIFYNTLNNPTKYLVNTTFCIDKVNSDDTNKCKNTVNDKVGLLTYQEYKEALANESYLNISKYWWTINANKDNQVWYVFNQGGVNSNSSNGDIYYSYGVRPVITLNSSTNYISGDGTKENPYIIEDKVSNIEVGKYITYSNKTWKVLKVSDESYELVLDDYVTVNDEYISKSFSSSSSKYALNDYTGLAYYLNNVFYKSLSAKSLIVDNTWYTGSYNSDTEYNYTNIYTTSIKSKVGLLNVTDLYTGELEDTYLITPSSDELVYAVKVDGSLYSSPISEKLKVRPVIAIKNSVSIISGEGTKGSPYVIE